MRRLGFEPFVRGLDEALQGGIPEGFWVSIFGPPGGYKTLHSLAWCLAGVAQGEKCVYVSTEMTHQQIQRQLETLGWRPARNIVQRIPYSSMLRENGEIDDRQLGDADIAWIDIETLRFWAGRLNRIVVEEREGERRQRRLWYNDPDLLAYLVMVGLALVGALRLRERRVTIEQVRYASLVEAARGRQTRFTPFELNRDVHVRVVIDSMAPFIVGRYSIAGKIMTDLKYRLMAPNVTFIVVNHVAKTTEDELGAEIGHVVDGRIRLWAEEEGDVLVHYGWILKMRETEHSPYKHRIDMQSGEMKVLVWRR